ncbi:BMP family lipoprotein [Changpingibacter yushuensis]|uniref:BMP family lipoprotein n=1 Tax=Changpingibacter yushuensis TaxID=2758440 RepID=UPI0015F42200|nr:BMP family ABC transporter substrate-binding protein [Changpingibacter yushuensis]
MKNLKFVAALGAAALMLGACSGNSDDSSDTSSGDATTAAEQIDYTACLVSDAGGWDDKSFNQSAMEGLQQAVSELGVKENDAESTSSTDFEPNVQAMVDSNCNLIIGVGFNLADAVGAAAVANSGVDFALVDSTFSDDYAGDNTRALVFNTQEAAYLAGYAAAAFTKTGTVATFGGIQIPSVTIFMDGFADGVSKYNEDNGTDVNLIGWDKDTQTGQFTNSFDDQTLGTQVANQLIQQGADIIMPVAGPVGLGAASAAQAAGDTYIVGVDSDWYESTEYGSITLTSVMKGIGASVFDTIKVGSEGNFSNENYIGTLENGGVDIAPFHDFESQLPDGLTDTLDQLKQDIIDGTIVVESDSSN